MLPTAWFAKHRATAEVRIKLPNRSPSLRPAAGSSAPNPLLTHGHTRTTEIKEPPVQTQDVGTSVARS